MRKTTALETWNLESAASVTVLSRSPPVIHIHWSPITSLASLSPTTARPWISERPYVRRIIWSVCNLVFMFLPSRSYISPVKSTKQLHNKNQLSNMNTFWRYNASCASRHCTRSPVQNRGAFPKSKLFWHLSGYGWTKIWSPRNEFPERPRRYRMWRPAHTERKQSFNQQNRSVHGMRSGYGARKGIKIEQSTASSQGQGSTKEAHPKHSKAWLLHSEDSRTFRIPFKDQSDSPPVYSLFTGCDQVNSQFSIQYLLSLYAFHILRLQVLNTPPSFSLLSGPTPGEQLFECRYRIQNGHRNRSRTKESGSRSRICSRIRAWIYWVCRAIGDAREVRAGKGDYEGDWVSSWWGSVWKTD